jgi:DNA-binding MarR family transcriptional regulator
VAAARVAEILERLCTLLRTEARLRGSPYSLQPVHVEALVYLERCNRYSDTPQAVTEYLGLTKGTVSQTLQVLERRGLAVKRQDSRDRRKIHLELTTSGRLLARSLVVPAPLGRALETLPAPADDLADSLRTLLTAMQRAAGHRSFGACRTCRYFQQEKGRFRCGLTGEPLTRAESQLICREHEPVKPGRLSAGAPLRESPADTGR